MRFYKLQNGNKYDLTAVATSLYDLIGEDLPEYLNYVVLQNTGGSDVRYLLNGNTPDGTNGFILKAGETVNYSIVNLRRLSMLAPGGAGSVQIIVGESSAEAGFDFQSYSTGGGGGGAEGALLIANNLSDITNDALARTNIGAGTGDGDMLASNNLSDVLDPAVARTNIGAGTGDLLSTNNLSDVLDPAVARTNLGAGTGDGDLLSTNNLSDVSDPAVARTNIGAGTGDGDMLASNNLSEVDPELARGNIGAGIGDMLASNNLSDVDNVLTAKANIRANYYSFEEPLQFGSDPNNPSVDIRTKDGGGVEVPVIEIAKNASADPYLQVGIKGASYAEVQPTRFSSDMSQYGGLVTNSEVAGHQLGIVPYLKNGYGLIHGHSYVRIAGGERSGGAPILQVGAGGGNPYISIAGPKRYLQGMYTYSLSGPAYLAVADTGSVITGGYASVPLNVETGLNISDVAIFDTDYTADSSTTLYRYVTLTQQQKFTLPPGGDLRESNNCTSFIHVKDESGNADPATPIVIQAPNNAINGGGQIVIDQPYGSVTIYFSKEINEYFTL